MARPNATGWFIVAFFLIGGIAFWIALPWVGIGQIWVGVAVLIGILYALMSRRADRMEALRTRGLPGQARILEMTQTGVYINENPQVKLKLHVEAAGIPPYELEKKVTVPLIALGTLGSGRPLSVYVDPNDHENLFVDWSGAPAGAAAGMVSAPFTFAFPDGTSVDLTNDGSAQAEVLEVLRANGLDPSSGTLDLRSNPKARQAVLDAVRRRGYRVPDDAGQPAAADGGDDRPGVERLMELQQMRDKGLIDEAEFEETKDRILKSL